MSAFEPRQPIQRSRLSRLVAVLTVASFALALALPTIDWFVRPDAARSVEREHRRPAPFPPTIHDLQSLSEFPAAFTDWHADRLGGRDLLLRASQRLHWLVLGAQPAPLILRGRDGFDFYALEESDRIHRGAHPAGEQVLESWRRSLEAQRDRCERLGARFVFVIAPDKESVYPDKRPESRPVIGPSRLDQLVAWLEARSTVRIVDLRAALRAEREHDRPAEDDFVYYRLGPHFTSRAGLAAWNEILNHLRPSWPSLPPIAREDYDLVPGDGRSRDTLWDRTYVDDLVPQKQWALWPRSTFETEITYDEAGRRAESRRSDPGLSTCLFVHDSFGPWMLPFAARSFAHMQAVWMQRVPREVIERLRPDFVIHEATERVLGWDLFDLAPDVLAMSPGEFSQLELLGVPLRAGKTSVLESRGGVELDHAAEGLWIRQQSSDGIVEVPVPSLPEATELALHVVLESPVETVLFLYFQTRTEPRFTRSKVIALNLEAGDNALYVRILVSELRGPLALRLESGREYRLHDIELRIAR